MLGVCLLFVGIVLINNGVCTLFDVDKKAAAIMNIFVGGLSVFINVVSLVQGNCYAAGTGLLFGFTYLFVAVNNIFKLDGFRLPCFRPLQVILIGSYDIQSMIDIIQRKPIERFKKEVLVLEGISLL